MLVGQVPKLRLSRGLLPGEVLKPLLERVPTGADVFVMALVGMPLYVCASGATPLAAALIAAGVSPGAGIAFLLSGPATNITTSA